jgi:hypothetical protein
VRFTRSHDEDTFWWCKGGKDSAGGIIGRAISDLTNPLAGLSVDGSSLLAEGSGKQPLSIGDLDNLGRQNIGWKTNEMRDFARAFVENGPPLASGNGLYIKNAMNNLESTIESIRAAVQSPLPNAADYQNGDGFMRSCYDAARLLTSPQLGVRLVALGRGGWDTHSNGRNSVYNNTLSLARGLNALIRSLMLKGEWQNTIILTMSEFSRTFWNGPKNPTQLVAANGSDHGHAGPVAVMSGALSRGGVWNDPADVARVSAQSSYLPDVEIDFRRPYWEAFRWAGFDVAKIFKEAPATHRWTELGLFV